MPEEWKTGALVLVGGLEGVHVNLLRFCGKVWVDCLLAGGVVVVDRVLLSLCSLMKSQH